MTANTFDAAQRQKIVNEWNGTHADFPADHCLHQLFEDHVASNPQAAALLYKDITLSYAELDSRANQLANWLIAHDVGPETLIGICTERSVELVVGILGILKAGAAYLPIDPGYPKDRVQFMLADTNVSTLLTQAPLLDDLPDLDFNAVCLDRDWHEISQASSDQPLSQVTPDNLCYVIYTSGSTGLPKGIALRHTGVVNNIYDLNTSFGIQNDCRTIAISALGFDMCVYEVLGTLAAGGAIVMPEQRALKDPAHWSELVAKHGVTVWNSAPALLELLVDYIESRPQLQPAPLKVVIQGGDWEPVTLPDRLRAIAPGARVIVLGGATEASIHSIVYPIGKVDPSWKSIPYGKPMKNQTAYILDDQQNPVPIGEPGELHLGGIGLARGYFERPELTSEKFIAHPFVADERLYRTGDLVRWMPDGNIELLGRIDFQVKIRGHRIELGEIIAKLQEHESVQRAVVILRDDVPGDKRLTAYIVPKNSKTTRDSNETEVTTSGLVPSLREMLGSALPDYMLPQDYIVLDQLPLTPNGKVDRIALPSPERCRSDLQESYVAPLNALQNALSLIWSEILCLDKIGIHDSFFAIGGHSLKGVQIVTQIEEMFGLRISLNDIFEAKTIENLACRIATRATIDNVDVETIAETLVEMSGLSEEELQTLYTEAASQSE